MIVVVSVMEVYRPAEDSYLIAKYVTELVDGEVLDMGTGSGIQAVTAAQKPEVARVTAVDINPRALETAREMAEREGVDSKITFLESDLFKNVDSRFDWILFNTPYLPSEGDADELSWAGGPTGAEIIQRFLRDAPNYLNENGAILMVFSSHSNLSDEDMKGFNWAILEEKSLFFEKLYCVRLTPS